MKRRIIGLVLIIVLLPIGVVSLTMDENCRNSVMRSIYFMPKRLFYYEGISAAKRYVQYLMEGNYSEIGNNFYRFDELDSDLKMSFSDGNILDHMLYLEKIKNKLNENRVDTMGFYCVWHDEIGGNDLLMVEFIFDKDPKKRITIQLINQSNRWLVYNFGVYGESPTCVNVIGDSE